MINVNRFLTYLSNLMFRFLFPVPVHAGFPSRNELRVLMRRNLFESWQQLIVFMYSDLDTG